MTGRDWERCEEVPGKARVRPSRAPVPARTELRSRLAKVCSSRSAALETFASRHLGKDRVLFPPLAKGGLGGVASAQPITEFSEGGVTYFAAPLDLLMYERMREHEVDGVRRHPPWPPLRKGGKRVAALLFLVAFLGSATTLKAEQSHAASTVGMPARIEQLVLSGTELEAKPIEDRRAPLVLRVAASYPHGTAFRYDLVYYGLEPGTYDLKDYLRRKDGSSMKDISSIPVRVEPVLPPGQIQPHSLVLAHSPFLGGYRVLLVLGGVAWVAGLAAILLTGRWKRSEVAAESIRPLTLADRLRPLVNAAVAGNLTQGQHAELERLLIGYWRNRLGLEKVAPAEFIGVMRNHEEAGPLLRRLEDWLHRPGGEAEPVDVAALLKPYQTIAADPLEAGEAIAAKSAPLSLKSERRS